MLDEDNYIINISGISDKINKNNKNIDDKKSNYWRMKDVPSADDRLPDSTRIQEEGKNLTLTEILAPLDEVFIDDSLKDDIVTRTAIPELLNGSEPGYSGVILFGPPGTGKTVLLRAIGEVYNRAGAYSQDISLADINSKYVGEFAKNLDTIIQRAISEAKKRGKPSFLAFDEGSILVQNAEDGSVSVAKHYQEALEVLKRYVGNNRNFVIAISTNTLPDSFEQALTREGRITPYFIGYPNIEQRTRMWKYFTDKYNGLNLNEEQAENLAGKTPEEQGAFIEEFCRTYSRTRRAKILQEKGYNTLVDALKQGVNINEEEIRMATTYDIFSQDLADALQAKEKRNGKQEVTKKLVGFKIS